MSRVSLKRLLVMGLGVMLCATLLLTGGWWFSLQRLQEMKARLYTDAAGLQAAQSLESAVGSALLHQRLFRATGQSAEREHAQRNWREAEKLMVTLPGHATSEREHELIGNMETRLRVLTQTDTESSDLREATAVLRASALQYRALNEEQMRQTINSGNQLERQMRIASGVFMALSILALAWGGLHLWTRIFRPILELSRASTSFGKGGPEARVPILWDDEMGDLCQSFNEMTQDIATREKERLDFVATVAHDLKSPLVVIGGAAELLLSKELSTGDLERWLPIIRRNVRSLERIVADLTDGVQAQTGRLQLEMAEFDFAFLAREITDQCRESMPDHQLHFEGEAAAVVRADRDRLERVIWNLLTNAIKYSKSGSMVRVTVDEHPGIVVLRVEDEGIGIAPEDMARVFQPFSRLEQAQTMASGTGLGLSSARKIIEAHGGIVRLMSQPNHGTTVEVRLPHPPTKVAGKD